MSRVRNPLDKAIAFGTLLLAHTIVFSAGQNYDYYYMRYASLSLSICAGGQDWIISLTKMQILVCRGARPEHCETRVVGVEQHQLVHCA